MSWTNNVRKVVPYVPGEQPKISDIIKLNTNENPYPPAKSVEECIHNFDVNVLRKYPDPDVTDLVNAIAKYEGFDPSEIFIGVGSDDVLAMCFLTFFNGSKPIVFPDITYSFYDVWADLFRIPYDMKPLDDNFRINMKDYLEECGGIVIPNPNAPTGVAEPVEFFENIIKEHKECVVVIDEAYVEFGTNSCRELVRKYDNVIVVRTFSKSRGMAGNRIGYAIGSKELIGYLKDCKFSFNSYTMDSITIAAGVASIQDDTYFKATCKHIMDTREWTKQELTRLGFTFPDSKTNFIFASHKSVPAKEIFEKLKEHKIYVRYFNKPRIDNYLRISIGTDDEMRSLITALEEICNV